MGLRTWWSNRRRLAQPVMLDEFVRDSLVRISRGLRQANQELKASGTIAENNFFLEFTHKTEAGREPVIEFDVAVTSKAEGGVKVGVVNAAVGGSGHFALAQESVSRIKFVVHVKNWLG